MIESRRIGAKMKQIIFTTLITLFFLFSITGCGKTEQPENQQVPGAESPPESSLDVSGVVSEMMNSGGYTYVQINTGSKKVWAAVTQTKVEIGSTVGFREGMLMSNFKSETLDRTFDEIYFVQQLMKPKSSRKMPDMPTPGMQEQFSRGEEHSQSPDDVDMDFSKISVPSEGYSISEIFQKNNQLSGEMVIIRGKVVKFNAEIMGKNWLHIQDGTGKPGTDDITVTTSSVANLGDMVVVEGVLTLDKDFGFGYKYDLLIEDAKIVIE
jgi:hypothetical protein